MQKMTKRSNTLEEVNNNVKLLSEMLSHYDRDRSSDADHELMKVRSDSTTINVYKMCRPRKFKEMAFEFLSIRWLS